MPNAPSPSRVYPPQFLDTDHLDADLKGRSVRGGAVTFVSQSSRILIQTAGTAVLARMLLPADYGLVAMVTAITGFLLLFRDMGLSAATVQRAVITQEQVSTLFWINVGVGAVLGCVAAALSPAVAVFYKEPRLLAVMLVLSAGFPVSGAGVQHTALLRRQMRFVALSASDIVSVVAGFAVGIAMAARGAGYWALVGMNVTMAVAQTAAVWVACGWRPGPPVRGSGVRPMLAFGGFLSAFGLVNYFARNMDNILIGRFRGGEELGYYSRAYTLLLLPVAQVTAPLSAVAVPALSRLQDDPERYRRYYAQALRLVAYVSFPMIATGVVFVDDIVRIVLGQGWEPTGSILRVLSIAAAAQPIGATAGWLYVSLGRSKRMAIWAMFACPLIVLSFVLGLPWGALGVATAYSLCVLVLLVPQFWYATRDTPVALGDVGGACLGPFCLTVIFALVLGGARAWCVSAGTVLSGLAAVVAGFAVTAGIVFALPSLRSDLIQILALGRNLLGGGRRGDA